MSEPTEPRISLPLQGYIADLQESGKSQQREMVEIDGCHFLVLLDGENSSHEFEARWGDRSARLVPATEAALRWHSKRQAEVEAKPRWRRQLARWWKVRVA